MCVCCSKYHLFPCNILPISGGSYWVQERILDDIHGNLPSQGCVTWSGTTQFKLDAAGFLRDTARLYATDVWKLPSTAPVSVQDPGLLMTGELAHLNKFCLFTCLTRVIFATARVLPVDPIS